MTLWNRFKPLDHMNHLRPEECLKRTLSWPQLVAIGVGSVVGTGIYTLTGVGADRAGPAVILAFMVAGVVCACAALAYAELASMMPTSGSAYSYVYTTLGEPFAWVIAWSLILEYGVAASAVAVGWSGYVTGFLIQAGFPLPVAISAAPDGGGIINLPALVIVAAVTWLLIKGTEESATVNVVLVVLKLAALALFVVVAGWHFDSANLHPFAPYGLFSHAENGEDRGILGAASIVFFAFFGFDTVSCASEEAKRPDRDLAIGIIGSMLISTLIYMAVAAAAVGALHWEDFALAPDPLAAILRAVSTPTIAGIVSAAAVITLPTVILTCMYGQTRIFFVMARDRLLPPWLAKVDPVSGTPMRMTLTTAIGVALFAAFLPLDKIAELANAGTLLAFIAVAFIMLLLRVQEPGRRRSFRAPLAWVVGPLAILGCLMLLYSLPASTKFWFVCWNLLGVTLYACYGYGHSRLAPAK